MSAGTKERPYDVWASGLQEELNWWDDWFRSKGKCWPEDYRFRVDKKSLLADDHAVLLRDGQSETVRILDVGSGPLTVLGKKLPGHSIHIVAIDALADEYNKLLSKWAIDTPVKLLRCNAEEIGKRFRHCDFDLVHARNALDHTYDPVSAIDGMVSVVRSGCYVVLNHAQNEAENSQYKGLHKWNLSHAGGRCLIAGYGRVIDINDRLSAAATVEILPAENGWFSVRIRRF